MDLDEEQPQVMDEDQESSVREEPSESHARNRRACTEFIAFTRCQQTQQVEARIHHHHTGAHVHTGCIAEDIHHQPHDRSAGELRPSREFDGQHQQEEHVEIRHHVAVGDIQVIQHQHLDQDQQDEARYVGEDGTDHGRSFAFCNVSRSARRRSSTTYTNPLRVISSVNRIVMPW
jgi:hypothetical protein